MVWAALVTAGSLLWDLAPPDSTCLRRNPPSGGVAFVDVGVLPMDRERFLTHQTVLVRGCRIEASLGGHAMEAVRRHGELRTSGDTTRLEAGLLSYVGSIRQQRARYEDAILVFDLALMEDSTRAGAQEGIARAHLSMGKILEARQALARALIPDPKRESARALLEQLNRR